MDVAYIMKITGIKESKCCANCKSTLEVEGVITVFCDYWKLQVKCFETCKKHKERSDD